jgi:hypothetical protein
MGVTSVPTQRKSLDEREAADEREREAKVGA